MNALQQYLQLSPEYRRLLRDKRIEGEHTLGEWSLLLRRLSDYDRNSGKARTTSVVAGIGGAVAGIFLFTPFWLVSAGAAAFYFTTKKLDVDDGSRDAVLRMLAVLRDDVRPDEPVRLRLDLSGATGAKAGGSVPLGQRGHYTVTETRFTDPWAEGHALLADGSRLHWRATTVTVRRTKKAGGKTKIKDKHKQRLDVRLGLPLRRYRLGEAPAWGAQGEQVEVKPGPRRISVKLQSTLPTKAFEPWQLTSLIASGFRQVASAKEVRP